MGVSVVGVSLLLLLILTGDCYCALQLGRENFLIGELGVVLSVLTIDPDTGLAVTFSVTGSTTLPSGDLTCGPLAADETFAAAKASSPMNKFL